MLQSVILRLIPRLIPTGEWSRQRHRIVPYLLENHPHRAFFIVAFTVNIVSSKVTPTADRHRSKVHLYLTNYAQSNPPR